MKAAGGEIAFVFDGDHDLVVAGAPSLVKELARVLSP